MQTTGHPVPSQRNHPVRVGNVSETGWIKYRPFSPSCGSAAIPPPWLASTRMPPPPPDGAPSLTQSRSGTPPKALLLHLHNGTGDLSGTNGARATAPRC